MMDQVLRVARFGNSATKSAEKSGIITEKPLDIAHGNQGVIKFLAVPRGIEPLSPP
jgi:hypothetical protein